MGKQETISVEEFKRRYLKEEDIQSAIRAHLLDLGYICLQTSHRTRAVVCHCGAKNYPTKGYGADYGVPDLLVSHKSWQAHVWIGLEVKGPKTKISPQQEALSAIDRICIVRSVDDALAAIKRFQG